ncbi:HTTM domain-containing protein [Caulobacter endophyticus]|uniref:HTTM domain-containing protein n=1 Tax=Caulobacter endophyticus TaxID=2172652 RepID=UPI00240FCCC7|nr:HTTM domain-containing protein [Caulobacter endophyticus]MDG2529029.1 HTTM domain-containing protein [Caulobacter endophyticus]
MSFDHALRLTEVLLALALIQQSLEHLRVFRRERLLFGARILLCVLLVAGVASPWSLVGLAGLSLLILQRFQGPYNGGSDRLGLLALWCVALARVLPVDQGRELAFGYLGVQLMLSYFISGWVKIVNPDWRRGAALRQVFAFSAYPVAESLRGWADRPRLLLVMSWAVMLFELAFPLTLLSQPSLMVGLVVAATFHLANACLFGLNRFFWTWLAAYPAILWLQQRLF